MERNTLTRLFEANGLSAQAVAIALEGIGDSTTEADCLLRRCLQEILRLRCELQAEADIVNALEEFGLQTTSSIFGVHSTAVSPSFNRQWVCWQGTRHKDLRSAVRQAVALQRGKGKR